MGTVAARRGRSGGAGAGTGTSGAVSWPGFERRAPRGQARWAGTTERDAVAARLVRALGELHGIAIARAATAGPANGRSFLHYAALPVTGDRRLVQRALRLLAVLCEDPVCCEEVGWLGGHHLFLREILQGSEEAEAAVMACTSCAPLVEFPTPTKPGLSVSEDDRRPALTFSFEAHGETAEKGNSWHIVLQEINTAADVVSDRINMTVGYHHWDAGLRWALRSSTPHASKARCLKLAAV